MNATELRMNNWALLNDKPTQLTRMIFKYEVVTYMCENITPLPLTEEWLKKFGFKDSGKYWFCGTTDPFSHIESDAYDCNGNFGYCLNDEKVIFLEVKYVHSLQNLCFALTGTELDLINI